MAITFAIQNYEKMWFCSVGAEHPLDFQCDPNKVYCERDTWMDKDNTMIIGSQAEALAKNDFFYIISKWEKLEACGKHNQAIKLDYYEVHAIFKLLHIYDSVNSGFSLLDGPLDPSMDPTYRKVYTSARNATELGPMEIPPANVVPLLDVCKSVFEDTTASPVDAAKDPAHPQVTALRKLTAITVDRQLRPVTLDSEELKSSLDGWQFHVTPSLSTLKGKAPKTTKTTPPSPPSVPESIPKDNLAGTPDEEALIASGKEIVDRLSSICETKFPEAFAKSLDKLDVMRGGALKAYVDIIDDGLNTMQKEQDKTLEQLASMRKKAAEDLRSERGAYATLKRNLSKKVEDLEKVLETTKKNLQKTETKIAKRAEQHSAYVQKLQSQLETSDAKYQQELEAHGFTKLDYESTLEELDKLKATSRKTSDEHDAKLLAQEQELPKLRSSRTNPKIEKDNIEQAVRGAVRAKQIEVDDVKAESRQKQAEIDRLQIELTDMQDALQQKEFELDEKQLELNDVLEQLADDKPSLEHKNEIINTRTSNLTDTREALEEQNRLARTLPIVPLAERQATKLEEELKTERAKRVFGICPTRDILVVLRVTTICQLCVKDMGRDYRRSRHDYVDIADNLKNILKAGYADANELHLAPDD
ncbi:hypothetical protein DL98DRAFT_528396 [Cadophora sp. DSE1049]|nr:hypothetical protein DL98DRAFT_528396 [Cadophora sp. DSE1049]